MSREFRLDQQLELPATPDQVWAAIATGPGVDSWFMGRTDIEPREGGRNRFTMLGESEASTITAWEPGKHFAHRGAPAANGSFMAFEYLIEARAGASTTVRLVQSGVLGDDWETEYEAMKAGWPMYLGTLAAYLTHFAGRIATPITAIQPGAGEPETAWASICAQFGLRGAVAAGDRAHFVADGLPSLDGVVDIVELPHYFGVRTAGGLYRFIHSGRERGNAIVIGHHIFGDIDRDATEPAWQSWLSALLGSAAA